MDVAEIKTIVSLQGHKEHDAGLLASERRIDSFAQTTGKMGQTLDGVAKGGAFENISKGLSSMSSSLQSVGSNLTSFGVGISAAFTAPIVYAVKAASDFNEALNKNTEVFGSSAAAVADWAANSVTNLGLSRSAALDAASGFGNLFVQLGVGKEKAAQMSTSIVALAADFASFHNADISEVLNAQSAAFRGEYDSLQRFLPLMSAATVEQEALAMTHKATTKELTAQDKALAVNALMFKGAGAAVGDFARTSDGMANVMRIVRAQIEDLAIQVGQEFLPKVQAALVVIRSWMKAFSDLSPEVKGIIIQIVGFGAVLGPVLIVLGGVATALGALISPVGLVAAAVGALAVAFATNFGGIRDTISRWVAEGKKYYEDHKADIQALGVKAKEIFDTYIADLGKVAADLINLLNQMKTAIDGFSANNDGSWKAIAKAAEFAVFAIDSLLKLSVASFQAAVEAIKAFWAPLENIIINPIKNAINWIKSNMPDFSQAGKLIGEGLIKGHDSAVYKSPHFLIHKTMDALDEVGKKGPAASSKAGKEIAKALKKAFEDELKDINAFLERAFGGTGSISEIILKELKKKFPDVAKELNAEAEAFRRVNQNLELYAVLMSTAAGRNTEVAQKITTAIEKLKAFDKELASNVIPQVAKLNNELNKTLPISEDMGEAIRKTVGTLVELTIGAKRAGDATQKLSEENLKRLGDVNAELARKIPQSWNTILDAIVNKSGAVGTAVYELSNKLKGWAGDIIGLVDTIPGHFGDAARKVVSTVDQWVNFADKVLAVLHRMNEKIPESIGGMIESVIGMFKKSQPAMKSASEDWAATLEKMSKGPSADAGGESGKSFSESFLGKLGLIASGVATFFGSRGQGKLAGVLGGAMAGATIGTAIAPGIGTAIGAAIGGIVGLFGSGKSKEQKAAEEKAKQQAALDMQKFVADLNNSILDGLNKGFELLEKLQTFSEVPRKAIKRFINEIFQILRTFVEMSAQFKAEGLAQAKLVSDNLGGAFDLLLSGADLVEKIRGIEAVTQKDVDNLFSSVDKILDGWFSLVEHIEKGVAKRASKMSGLLATSLETIQLIPATIKAMTEVPDITDEQIDRPFVWGKRILDKFFDLADQFKTLALNRTVKTAEAFAKIFESGKSMFEFLKLWTDYKPLEDSAFDAVNSDFDRVTNWFLSAIDKSTQWLGLSETLRDNILHLAAEMSDISNAITGAFGGAGSSQNFTLQQSSSSANNGLGLGAAGSSSSTMGGSSPVIVNVNVQGNLISQSQLPEAIAQGLQALQRQKRLTINIL